MKGVYQKNIKDCGVACLLTIIKFYGGSERYEDVRYLTGCNNNGVSALNLVNAAKKLGFNARGLECNFDDLNNLIFPLICHMVINDYQHYVVITKISNNNVYVFDPMLGKKVYSYDEFIKLWDKIVIELVKVRSLNNNKESYKDILSIVFNNKFLYLFVFLTTFISLFLSLICNYYFKSLIDYKNKLYCLLLFSLVIIIKELTDLIKNKLLIKLDINIEHDLYINTHKNMFLLPYYYFNTRCTGDITTKYNDLSYIKDLYINVPLFIFIDLVLIVISSLILINISLDLFILFIVICITYILVILLFNRVINKCIVINQELNSNKNSIINEDVKGISTIKNLNIEEYRSNIFNKIFSSYQLNRFKLENTYNYLDLIKNLILLIGINIILYNGIILVDSNIISLSDLILFNSILLYFVDPLNNICELNKIIKNGVNALKRVNEMYNNHNKILYDATKYDISFNNLTYSYDGYNNIIKDFNYKISEKDKIIVKGESGVGKSTLFKLLNKTYEVNNNMIYLGSDDINDVKPNIVYVSQDEILFNDSIYNNIVLDSNIDNLEDILNITKVSDLLKNKNININTIMEEDGSNFSKGEKQKIILARSLLKNSNIYILDEVLSNVSKLDEYDIINNILKYYNNKTIIYITHTDNCDNLFGKKLEIKEAL